MKKALLISPIGFANKKTAIILFTSITKKHNLRNRLYM